MRDPQFTTLRSERLTVRRFRSEDAEALAAYRDDPEVARYQGWERPYSVEEAASFIAGLREADPGTPGAWFQFAVGLGESPALIGDVALRVTIEDPGRAELGFSFATAHQGRGYAAEAVRSVIDYARTSLGIEQVFAITDARNLRAQALLDRLGFRREQRLGEDSLLYVRSVSEDRAG